VGVIFNVRHVCCYVTHLWPYTVYNMSSGTVNPAVCVSLYKPVSLAHPGDGFCFSLPMFLCCNYVSEITVKWFTAVIIKTFGIRRQRLRFSGTVYVCTGQKNIGIPDKFAAKKLDICIEFVNTDSNLAFFSIKCIVTCFQSWV